MRNDTHRWTAPSPLSRVGAGVTITEVTPSAQHVVSGANVLTLFSDRLTGWPDRIATDSYVLTLRRDRVLVVGQTDLLPGYAPETGLAVTDITDAYAMIDLAGPNALTQLRQGAEIRLDHPSRSMVRRLFGCDVMLCCLGDDEFRLHIPKPQSQMVVEQLK